MHLPIRIRLTLVVFAMSLSACASMPSRGCAPGERFMLHDSLYFGTAAPSGVVTLEEWGDFLKNTVTPRFPQGLSVWPASGQWRSSDGTIIQEASYVLNLVHPGDESSEKAVLEIVAAYKSRYQQEAVLRVKTRSCASF